MHLQLPKKYTKTSVFAIKTGVSSNTAHAEWVTRATLNASRCGEHHTSVQRPREGVLDGAMRLRLIQMGDTAFQSRWP
jgi:hypothetical protein